MVLTKGSHDEIFLLVIRTSAIPFSFFNRASSVTSIASSSLQKKENMEWWAKSDHGSERAKKMTNVSETNVTRDL
jgi:hypothetical protein